MSKFWTFLLIVFTCGIVTCAEQIECNLAQDVIDDIASYSDVVLRIIDLFKNGKFKGRTYKEISDFVDKFGPRLTGSEALEMSIDYMYDKSLENDMDDVHTEELDVPYWFRNEEYAYMIEPRQKEMKMIGIGFSPPTPEGGINASAIVVKSFAELDSFSNDDVNGKIVVFDQPFTTYGETVKYRNSASSEASKKGAVAVLIRSITQFSIASPHGGDQIYYDGVKKIPAAQITHEDADFLRRQYDRGHNIVIHLRMSPIFEMRKSRNLIAGIEGSTSPEKYIIVAGHIDSWDLGDGSMDDAGGCFISWLAPIAMKELNLVPKRTIRTVLFTGEEQGLFGAIDYEERHRNDSENLVFLMESDTGTFAPLGLYYEGSDEGQCMMQEILKLFTSINATELLLRSPAPDISVWTDIGFPGAGLHNDNGEYFWYHHSEGDTLNVLDSEAMDLNGGFWTAVAYIVADMKHEAPKITIKKNEADIE